MKRSGSSRASRGVSAITPHVPQDRLLWGRGATVSVEGEMGPRHGACWRGPRDQVTVAGREHEGDFLHYIPICIFNFLSHVNKIGIQRSKQINIKIKEPEEFSKARVGRARPNTCFIRKVLLVHGHAHSKGRADQP